MSKDNADPIDALALQFALMFGHLYPASGDTKNDCPLSGRIGACTMAAIAEFQRKNNITGEKGVVGKKTRAALNEEYKLQAI